jgi:hypothetical protein
VAGPYDHGNEPSGYIKGWELLGELSHCHSLKKDCASWSHFGGGC